MGTRRNKWLFFGLLVLLTALWLRLEPGCIFRSLTGFPCPGCGMSRAWLAALRGDFAGALRFHPMFWVIPLVLWLGWHGFRPFRRPLWNILATGSVTAAYLLVYAIRLTACF